jgi:hypothetical protein
MENATFCATVSQANRRGSWNTMPIAGCGAATSSPSTLMRPPIAWSRPAARRKSVLLPQPDAPMTATISASSTPRQMSSSACAPVA